MINKQVYSGKEFGDALLRRGLSPAQFARNGFMSASTISKWCKDGVPVKWQGIVKQKLDAVEVVVYGANHQDLFPDTVKDDL